MRPNKTGIGLFEVSRRKVNAVKLFTQVYKVFAWIPETTIGYGFILNEVAFIHDCNIDGRWPAYYINENGYCTQCGKFIATHKKLEVMAGLKELND